MAENGRPDIRPEWSLLEKILQIFCPLILLLNFVLLAAVWKRLPERIPTHFGVSGTADAWGGRGSLLMLPFIGAAMYAGLTVLERFPKIFNMPVEITEKNARFQYQAAREMLVCLKTILLVTFSYIQWHSVRAARGGGDLGPWFLPVSMILMFGVLAFYLLRMRSHREG